jgi:pyruvate/2-oxoglutarate dehydrogenase complex dihydrolipoamide acyltransferase (E2) component
LKITLRVPKSAVSSVKGTLSEWHIEDGGMVAAGDLIYSIELEKAILDVAAPFPGQVHHIATVGDEYPVGAPIAELITKAEK